MGVEGGPVVFCPELHGVFACDADRVEPHPFMSVLWCNTISVRDPCLGVDLDEVGDALDVLQEARVAKNVAG